MDTPPNDPQNPAPAAPAPDNPPPAPAPVAIPPPAATIVKEGKTQAELDLEAKLAERDKMIKDRELSLAQMMDENQQLKHLTRPTPVPRKKKSCMEAFFSGED